MIAIQDLQFRYPKSEFVLQLQELEIPDGSRTAIVGPSGSGKTTLLNLIAGITKPDSGMIQIGSETISGMGDAQRRNFRISNIGLVFQRFELIEYLDVINNILLPFRINQTLQLNREARDRAESLASSMGLADKLKRLPSRLSQGEQQRVAICRALINQPKILLADEPTGNLDPANKRRIMDLLFEQSDRQSQTLIVVTHDMSILEGFETKIDFETFVSTDLQSVEGNA